MWQLSLLTNWVLEEASVRFTYIQYKHLDELEVRGVSMLLRNQQLAENLSLNIHGTRKMRSQGSKTLLVEAFQTQKPRA